MNIFFLIRKEEEEPGADAEKKELEEGVSQGVKRGASQGVQEGDKYIINSLVIIYGKFSGG